MLSTHSFDESLFLEIAKVWDLERLYADLAEAKGKDLTHVEKKLLCALLIGYSPNEIAEIVYQSPNSASVRVTLSRKLYRYLESLLAQRFDTTLKIEWSRVRSLLEKAGYRIQ